VRAGVCAIDGERTSRPVEDDIRLDGRESPGIRRPSVRCRYDTSFATRLRKHSAGRSMPAASGRSRRMRRRRPRCWHLRDRQRRPRRHKGATGSLKLSLQGDAEIQTDEPMFRIGRGEAGRRHIVRMGGRCGRLRARTGLRRAPARRRTRPATTLKLSMTIQKVNTASESTCNIESASSGPTTSHEMSRSSITTNYARGSRDT